VPDFNATARQPTPQGEDTGPPRKRAHRALQRRLRHAMGYVDWRDAIAGALLGQALDALGGSAAGDALEALLAALLDM